MSSNFNVTEKSNNIIEKTDSQTAVYNGKYSEYEFCISNKMQGYYIITHKTTAKSDLINSQIKILQFSDCTKTLQDIINELNPKSILKKRNINIKKPEQISQFPFEVIEKTKPPFEVIENQNTPNEQNIIDKVSLKGNQAFDNSYEEKLHDAYVYEQALNQAFEYKKFKKVYGPQLQQIEYISDDDMFRFNFGKLIYISQNISDIRLYINKFDENNDGFYFKNFPNNLEYKYGISKDKFFAHFIANLSAREAIDFISTFEFATKNRTTKQILVFANDILVYNDLIFEA